MSFYWIYDLPNWLLCIVIILIFVGLAVVGLLITRPIVRRITGASPKHNDIVSYFLGSMGVFYGLALGLIAVATWENYTEVDAVVSTEAAAVASLYRDLDGYPEPLRGKLENMLRAYTRVVIDKEWPAHKQGVPLEAGDVLLDQFENVVMNFDPSREREKIAHAEVLRSLDSVLEQRRLRLQAVTTGLPAALWAVVLIGAFLNGLLTYSFWVENLWLHAILVAILATFIASLVFLTAAMDNPFRGQFSVSSDVFETIHQQVMSPSVTPETPARP